MILDAKPILWATTLILAIPVVGAGVAGALGTVGLAELGGFYVGCALLLGNLVLGAALVQRMSASMSRGEDASLAFMALSAKTLVLFASFGLCGWLLGMGPVVSGAVATFTSFTIAVLLAPLFSNPNPSNLNHVEAA